MEFIKDLGHRIDKYADSKTGKYYNRRWGLFKCPVCNKEIELPVNKGLIAKTCYDCKHASHTTHHMTTTRQYDIWRAMLQRCENPNNKKYRIYGGRGIKVCEKWHTFEGFWEDNKDQYKDDLTIDRIDSNGNYEPSNVQWVSLSRNSAKTSRLRPVIQCAFTGSKGKEDKLNPDKYVPIKYWNTTREAALALDINPVKITQCCSKKYVHITTHGFAWCYADEFPQFMEILKK